MAEEILDGYDPSEHLEELKNNHPVEPVEGDLEDCQYESAKESYDKAVKLRQEEIDKVEAQL